MKAVVLEIRDGVAAVLMEDKTIRHIRCDCEVGDTIEIEDYGQVTRFPKRMTRWAAAAAAAIVLISGGSYGYNNAYAYSYVTLDANPSIEYVLNRHNEVISVSALNEDAVSIVEEINSGSVRGSALAELLEETTVLLYRDEYLDSEDDCLLISVASRGERQREALNTEIEAFNEKGSLSVYLENASMEEERSARSLGMSTGRYMLMEDVFAENGSSGDGPSEFGEAPVEELLQRSGRRPAPEEEGSRPQEQPAISAQRSGAPEVDQSVPENGENRPEMPEPSGETGPGEGTGQNPQSDGSTVNAAERNTDNTGETGSPSGEPSR